MHACFFRLDKPGLSWIGAEKTRQRNQGSIPKNSFLQEAYNMSTFCTYHIERNLLQKTEIIYFRQTKVT